MSQKKKQKHAAYAKMLWERAQLRAATTQEQIDKATAIILMYKEELTPQALSEALAKVEEQRGEIKAYVIKERDKFARKVDEIGEQYFRELLADDHLYQTLKGRMEDGSEPIPEGEEE